MRHVQVRQHLPFAVIIEKVASQEQSSQIAETETRWQCRKIAANLQRRG